MDALPELTTENASVEKEYAVGTVRHPLLCRWWQRVREVEPIRYADGSIGACHELYVPWWSWPLELLHRFIFGNPQFNVE